MRVRDVQTHANDQAMVLADLNAFRQNTPKLASAYLQVIGPANANSRVVQAHRSNSLNNG